MGKDPILYDPSGKPVKKEKDNSAESLTMEVQTFIESRLNSTVNQIRELNQYDLKELARKSKKPWQAMSTFWFFLTVIMAFIMWLFTPKWIEDKVDEKLTVPAIEESADRIIEGKVTAFIDDKIKPLNEQAEVLGNKIEKLQNDFAIKQAALKLQQNIIVNQQHIMQLAIAAKAGSRKSYNTLLELDETEPESKNLLSASLKEIELYYDADRSQLTFPTLVSTKTMKDPGYSVDEVIFVLRKQPDLADAAVNTLSKLKSKATVGELCRLIEKTEDLRVAARATRAIGVITGENIRPLDFDKVEKWWKENYINSAYLGNYDGYCYVAKKMWERPVPHAKLEEFILKLDETISSDENALHSYCLKAGFLAILGRIGGAKALIEIVKKKKSDFRWLNVWDAAIKIGENEIDSAVDVINKAFNKSPTQDVANTIRYWEIFDPIKTDDRIKWPKVDIDDAN